METSTIEEITASVSTSDMSTVARDTQRPFRRKLAIHLIPGSVLFERMAFYSLANNLVFTLRPDGPFHWQPSYRSIASNIFSGN